ncbi:BIIDXI-like protein At5g11420 [Typha angustifolia]|uniref:BIIDXI-like protein At5g11420 n=1 Tax=Typha angustifolia TaxID=59011 RepID=UPI003C30AD12
MEKDGSSTRIPLCFLLLLLLSQLVSAAVEDGLLNNGDFETAPAGGFASAAVGEAATSIPGWTINGTVELITSGQHQGAMILIVPQGEHAARLGNDAEIAQSVELERGSEYAVTFSAARTCAQLEALTVSMNDASQSVDLQTLYSIEGWDAYAWAFKAAAEEGRLAFKNPGMEDDPTCGPIIDNIAIKKLFTPDRPEDNQVANGDFEEGPWMFPNATLGVLLPTNLDETTSSVPGWTVEDNRAVRYVDADHFAVPQGKRAIELLSGKEGIISQMVETTPERQYNLTFMLGSAGDSCQSPMAVTAFAGDQTQNFHYSPTGNATHQLANLTFTAHAIRTRVAFYSVYYNTRSVDRSSLCGPVIDDVRVGEVSGSNGPRGGVSGPAHILLALLVTIALVFA